MIPSLARFLLTDFNLTADYFLKAPMPFPQVFFIRFESHRELFWRYARTSTSLRHP